METGAGAGRASSIIRRSTPFSGRRPAGRRRPGTGNCCPAPCRRPSNDQPVGESAPRPVRRVRYPQALPPTCSPTNRSFLSNSACPLCVSRGDLENRLNPTPGCPRPGAQRVAADPAGVRQTPGRSWSASRAALRKPRRSPSAELSPEQAARQRDLSLRAMLAQQNGLEQTQGEDFWTRTTPTDPGKARRAGSCRFGLLFALYTAGWHFRAGADPSEATTRLTRRDHRSHPYSRSLARRPADLKTGASAVFRCVGSDGTWSASAFIRSRDSGAPPGGNKNTAAKRPGKPRHRRRRWAIPRATDHCSCRGFHR